MGPAPLTSKLWLVHHFCFFLTLKEMLLPSATSLPRAPSTNPSTTKRGPGPERTSVLLHPTWQCDLGPAAPPCLGSPPSKAAHAQAGQQSGNSCVDRIPAPRGMAFEIHKVALPGKE